MVWDRRASGEPSEMNTAHWSVQQKTFSGPESEYRSSLTPLYYSIHISSGGNLHVGNTVLYLEGWKVSGAIRVNKDNCKDCPKADGKQRLNGIENRCEA